MSPFVYNTLTTLLKLLVLSGTTQDKLFIKFFIIIFIIIGLYLYYKHSKSNGNITLSAQQILDKYKLKNDNAIYISKIIVILYIITYITFILSLRIYNSYNPPNLCDIYLKMHNIISVNDPRVTLINFTLCILIIIIYIILLIKLFKYVRLNIIKLHLYYSFSEEYNKKHRYFKRQYSYIHIVNNLLPLRLTWPRKVLFGFSLRYHFQVILGGIHYITLLFCFIYDIVYNDGILKITYILLPIVFMYQIYVKCCDFVLGIIEANDDILNIFIYSKEEPVMYENDIELNDKFYDKKGIHDIIFGYLYYNLSFWHYMIISEEKQLNRYNYILDWKIRVRK